MATGAYSVKFVPRIKPKDKNNDAGHRLVTTNRADIGAALQQQWADKGIVSTAPRISSFYTGHPRWDSLTTSCSEGLYRNYYLA